jgi:hypothetical protein
MLKNIQQPAAWVFYFIFYDSHGVIVDSPGYHERHASLYLIREEIYEN